MKAVKPQLVNSLDNLLPNVIYCTNNYALLKPFSFNRGSESGLILPKVNAFKALMKKDEETKISRFEDEIFEVLVNANGNILDGAHKAEAAKLMGKEIHFRVLFGDKWQNAKTALPAIAEINNTNSIWTNAQNLNTAIALDSDLAMRLKMLRDETSASKFAVNEKTLTMAQIFTLLYRKSGHPSRIPLYDYFNEMFLKFTYTEQFLNEFDFCCYIVSRFSDSVINTTRIFEVILPMVWNGECDIDKFMRNSHKVNFAIDFNKANKGLKKHIKSKIEDVMKYK
jgi:hypothetical protein